MSQPDCTPDQSAPTRAVRAGICSDQHHGAVVPPIHLSSTFSFEGFNRKREFDYTRSGNPTRSQLGCALAELEGGASAIVTSTGMSAITTILQLLKPGELVIAAHDCYGGTHRLLKALASRGHFELVQLDLTALGAETEMLPARRVPAGRMRERLGAAIPATRTRPSVPSFSGRR